MFRHLLAGLGFALIAAGLVSCGGGSNSSAAADSRELQASLSHYETYLQKNSAKLLHWAETIVLKVEEGETGKAGSRYAAARVPYGHVAPAALLFDSLNRRIDGLEKDVPPGEFGGFHELERAIFGEEDTAGMTQVARQLRIDIEELQQKIDSAKLEPPQILAAANEVLEGILENEIWGKGEPWAHGDLSEMAAKAEGIDAAFEAVQPLVAESDPELAKRIEASLRAVFSKVGEYGILAREPEQARDREPGISFVVYDQLTQEKRWELAEPLKALARSLVEAEEKLG